MNVEDIPAAAPSEPEREALLPCPFCGGSDLHVAGYRKYVLEQVYCERCDAYGPARKPPFAEYAWNRRATLKGQP